MKRKLFGIVLIAIFAVSCAFLGMKPFSEWSPKAKADYFMRVYLSEARNADAVLKDPLATPAKKASALKNKELLIQVYPLIKVYISVVESGKIPPVPDEKQITDLIDKLIDLL